MASPNSSISMGKSSMRSATYSIRNKRPSGHSATMPHDLTRPVIRDGPLGPHPWASVCLLPGPLAAVAVTPGPTKNVTVDPSPRVQQDSQQTRYRISNPMPLTEIPGTHYVYDDARTPDFRALADRVKDMRAQGRLSPMVLHHIRRYFRIKNIYHSNAIEGNVLAVGETRQVVELGITLTGKPLKDQAEARNLAHALDFLEDLAGTNDTPITENDIRQLHALVLDGIHDEAGGYRTGPVEITGSQFLPPGPESVPAEMARFGAWLASVSAPGETAFGALSGLLAAAVAHTWFVTVHPFIDGNGRVARLLMNLLLMRHAYPIAIISKGDRLRYYDALEDSQGSDLTGFVALLAECLEESLEEYEAAAREHRTQTEWAQSLAEKFTEPERVRAHNEYEVWKSAMELLRSHLQQTVDVFDQAADLAHVYFKDFGSLEFEKYAQLRRGVSAKRTWFFRLDFRRDDVSARYLFFFGHASRRLRSRCDVTLHVAREEPPGSYNYERLDRVQSPNVPDLVEVGYEMAKERFVGRMRSDRSRVTRVEELGRKFFEHVVSRQFGAD